MGQVRRRQVPASCAAGQSPSVQNVRRGMSVPRIHLAPVRAVWRPAAAVSMRDRQRHCSTDSWRNTLEKQAARWCPGWASAAWVALHSRCMAPGLKRPKVSMDIARNGHPGHGWSAK
jgi:hypothetical protein